MNLRAARTLVNEILLAGRKRFDAMLGIVSRIHDDTYEIFAVASETGIPEIGDSYPLTAVYCREVVEKRHTVAITEIDGVPGLSRHPLYDAIPCECYLSSPIFVDDKVWGTLNYTSLEARDTPYSAEDIADNEAQALRIAQAVSTAMGNPGFIPG